MGDSTEAAASHDSRKALLDRSTDAIRGMTTRRRGRVARLCFQTIAPVAPSRNGRRSPPTRFTCGLSADPAATRTKMPYKPEDAIRTSLKSMAPYTPIVPYEVLAAQLGRKTSEIVKLDANENPYGPSPHVAEKLAAAEFLHVYPDPESRFLREALQEYTGVPAERLLVGAGADEIIDLLFRLFVTPGKGESVVNCPPTFGMYKFDADVNGAELIELPRAEGTFDIDVDGVERIFDEAGEGAYPKMIFVASPNNPDGSVLSDESLKRLLALPTLVVLDEAYFEFADDNRILWVPEYDNLVVLRTFSKWAGLAGLRVGYAAFPLPVIKHLWNIKQPYNVTVTSQIAAEASLKDKGSLLKKVERMIEQRGQFYKRVKEFPWLKPYPSQANYVLCRVEEGRSALGLKTSLAQRGILIRHYSSKGLSDCIRVSMGTEEQMDELYDALREL